MKLGLKVGWELSLIIYTNKLVFYLLETKIEQPSSQSNTPNTSKTFIVLGYVEYSGNSYQIKILIFDILDSTKYKNVILVEVEGAPKKV